MKMLYLSMRPTRGNIEMFGENIYQLPRHKLPKIRRRIGVVFQDFRLLSHLTALENVALPLKVVGARDEDINKHVAELLSWVGLKDHLHAYPETLSGGEQQRVAIARAVIAKPNLLLADEPTGNLDDKIAMRLMHLFVEMNKMGTTVVIATHNQKLVDELNYPQLHLEKGYLNILPPRSMQKTA